MNEKDEKLEAEDIRKEVARELFLDMSKEELFESEEESESEESKD